MIIKNNNTFHLQGKNISYIMTVNECGDLLHYHFGKKLADRDYAAKQGKNKGYGLLCNDENGIFLETEAQEFPAYGHTDLRNPAYSVRNRFGNTVSRLKFKDWNIRENETAHIEGMPSVFAGGKAVQTLEITLCDEAIGLETVLFYTVFDEYDIVLRSGKSVNRSGEKMVIERAYSASVDFEKRDMDFVYFPGAWCREREFVRTPICAGGRLEASNSRGGSGHAMNPFVMLCEKCANEKLGEVFGFSLVYSGNHSSSVECDQYGNIRIMQGINPFGFEFELSAGENFFTPQSILSYSSCGFGGISREMHDLIRDNLCKSEWSKKDRPVLINNWEGTYFDFTESKLIEMASAAKSLGIELFVLDDGWFGKRDDDHSSLGDWFANKEKLPSGVEGLAEKINRGGLSFGLWFEPEMVNPDSELYRKHPDWAIAVPNIEPSLGRNQYMLDLANDEVCDFIIGAVGDILRTANVSYVKWDYNRMMSDVPRNGYNHRYTLGLYRVLDALSEMFPNVMIEGCASGGGRFDAGMLAYSPQIWTSDNSDAVARLKIQYSTSMCYPISAISAHVTASPNHQNGRITSLKTRAEVAYAGAFGYELDITKLKNDELDEIRAQIEFYKEIRTLVRTGDFYRLKSPYESNYCCWQIVSKDKSETLIFGCRILNLANSKEEVIVADGLDFIAEYIDTESGEAFGGDELCVKGFAPEYENCDFSTILKHFKKR